MNLQDQCCVAQEVAPTTVMEEFMSRLSYETSRLIEARQRLESKVNRLVGYQGIPEPQIKEEKTPDSIIQSLETLSIQLGWAVSDLGRTVERLDSVL